MPILAGALFLAGFLSMFGLRRRARRPRHRLVALLWVEVSLVAMAGGIEGLPHIGNKLAFLTGAIALGLVVAATVGGGWVGELFFSQSQAV